MALLEVKNLEVYYGVICALKGISFEVNEGEIVSLIGANGAGKTTMMQSVVGLIPKKNGTVFFDGQDITKTPCHKIVGLGMTQVPEGRRIFQELSVYENLMMGAYTVKDQQKFKEDIEGIYQRFPRLAERRKQKEKDSKRKRRLLRRISTSYRVNLITRASLQRLLKS